MDFADANYSAFQVANARRVVREFPSVAGVCLDRGDFIGCMNQNADDGKTMINGKTARALLSSWRLTVPQVAEVLHAAGMQLWLNPDMGHRIDMYQHIDGIFDEIGDDGKWRTASAWLTSGGMPGAMWCHGNLRWWSCGAIMTNGSDAERHHYLQTHLYLGLNPSVPFPDNDHQILPAPRADAMYQQYGALFAALKGKRWATFPHAAVSDGKSLVNAFEMKPFGSGVYALAIAFGTGNETTVRMNNVPGATAHIATEGLTVGGSEVNVQAKLLSAGKIEVNVTGMVSGCAVVRIKL